MNIFSVKYQKMIFVATTGRSGTGSLDKLFEFEKEIYSCHEPVPIMNGKLMIDKNNGNERKAKKIFTNKKRIMIMIPRIFGYQYYIETNHMFIKSFQEYILDYFSNNICIIHLYRDPVLVAKSMYELNTIPGADIANMWYLDTKAITNRIIFDELNENDKLNHDYYKCLWYWYEIEARIKEFKLKNKNITIIDLKTEDLNDSKYISKLFKQKGIDNTLHIKSIQKKIVSNKKIDGKKRNLDIDDARSMHEIFKQILALHLYI